MRTLTSLLCVLLLSVAACGGATPPGVADARAALRAAQVIEADVEARVASGELPQDRFGGLLQDLTHRLSEGSYLVDEWEMSGDGEAGWHAIASCLAQVLGQVGQALEDAGRERTVEHDQAQALAEGQARGGCAR